MVCWDWQWRMLWEYRMSLKHWKREDINMGIYEKQQQLMDNVCTDLNSICTLIAPKEESKKEEYGFIPGMNNMQNEVKQLDEYLHTLSWSASGMS